MRAEKKNSGTASVSKHATPAAAAVKPGRRMKKRQAYFICSILAAILVIAVALVLRGISDKKSYNTYMDQARLSYTASDYDSALSALRKAEALEKNDDCLMLMADCYEAQGNYDKALGILRTMNLQDELVAARISTIENRRHALMDSEKVTIAGRQFPSGSTSLILDDMGLGSEVLSEISQLYSIDSLSLSGNAISDIGGVSVLGGLVTLNLSDNQIYDVSPLSGLASLRTLYLDNNPISDLTPLCSLTNLTFLSIKGMEITESELETLSMALPNCAIHSEVAMEEVQDITIGGVTFKSDVLELDLSGMGMRDISALANCQQLTSIDLSGNSISDLSPLMNIPHLEKLYLADNELTDLRPLMGIGTLRVLDASGNSITSTTALCMMTGLTELRLDDNPIRDFSGLRKLRSVTTLSLASTGITDDDLLYMSNLSLLKALDLEDNPGVTGEGLDMLQGSLATCNINHSDLVYSVDVDGHAVKSDATELDLSGTGISDISGLAKLSRLETVKLSMNSITNIYILEYSDSRFTIKSLDLSSNGIEDITPLASLQCVEELDLRNNFIGSELALMNLTTLKRLYIGGNMLSNEQLNSLQNTLINCEIIVG